MEIDCEKLVVLIKLRPAIYDFGIKEHHNKDIIDQLWSEIAEQLNCTVADCKMKWANLRNSFSRYVRQSAALCSRRKVWYLADAMGFMRNHIGPNKKAYVRPAISENDQDMSAGPSNMDEELQSLSFGSFPVEEKRSKISSDSEDIVLGSIAEYLKARSYVLHQQNTTNNQHLQFFKSLIPDIESLSPSRQRKFKRDVLSSLYSLVDEEEEDYNSQINSHS